MISFGSESLTCLEISAVVYNGLAVVAMAPTATTAKKATGKRRELGDITRTTSFLEMLRSRRALEKFKTWVFRTENVDVWPVSASTRAGKWEMDENFLKRYGNMENLVSWGREMGGLGDL